jgi:hypothetical protein
MKKTAKKIVEKGSYEKGKVEKYASKADMMKHEKKETKALSPAKQMTKSGPTPKTTMASKGSAAKMKKC